MRQFKCPLGAPLVWFCFLVRGKASVRGTQIVLYFDHTCTAGEIFILHPNLGDNCSDHFLIIDSFKHYRNPCLINQTLSNHTLPHVVVSSRVQEDTVWKLSTRVQSHHLWFKSFYCLIVGVRGTGLAAWWHRSFAKQVRTNLVGSHCILTFYHFSPSGASIIKWTFFFCSLNANKTQQITIVWLPVLCR